MSKLILKLMSKLIIIIFSLILINTALAQSEHYIIVGHIYSPYNSTTIYIQNIRTSETMNVNIRDCEHNLKEYLFDLSNFKQGWITTDKLLLNYDNKSVELNINTKFVGIQKDINKPDNYNPIPVIIGTTLILSASGLYYYIKRKKTIKQ